MSRNLIPYTALKGKGVPYSKPHLWRLEKIHAEVLRRAPSLSEAHAVPDTGSADQPSVPLFPLRVPIGPGRYGYVEEEIDAYVAALIAARDAKHDHAPDAPL